MCCLDIDQETQTQSRSSDVAYRICGIAAPWHYGPVALRPVPARIGLFKITYDGSCSLRKKNKKTNKTNKQTMRSESMGTSLVYTTYRLDNHVETSVLFTWEEQRFKIKLCSSCDSKYDVIYVPFSP